VLNHQGEQRSVHADKRNIVQVRWLPPRTTPLARLGKRKGHQERLAAFLSIEGLKVIKITLQEPN
jgi:hypothetical protein